MSIEIIGLLHPHERSETHHADGAIIDPGYIRRVLAVHETHGYDRILIGSSSSGPDSLQMAAFAAAQTQTLKFMVAHRPGFIAPTVAARAFATLDQFAGGRVAMHTISGRDDAEQRSDGDYLGKAERYERTGEYLEILRRGWTETAAFDFTGAHYRFERFRSEVHPKNGPLPIYFAGSSEEAFAVGVRHADVYMFYAEPLANLSQTIGRVRREAAEAGRTPPRVGIIVRPVIAETDELAWQKARRILEVTTERAGRGQPMMRGSHDMEPDATPGVGDARQIAYNRLAERHDRALWTAVTGVTKRANSTALVGSAETVARALLDYVDLGVSTLLLHGFSPLEDAESFGRNLLPLLRDPRLAEAQPTSLAS